MNSIEDHILKWISKISIKRDELGGFPICPFASKAKFKIIECQVKDIMPISGYDILFYVIEDYFDLDAINFWVEFYNLMYPEYIFLEDHSTSDSYINGIQTNNGKYNLILCQNREDLRKNRKNLALTEYYTHWDEKYLKEILADDYNLIIKGIETP